MIEHIRSQQSKAKNDVDKFERNFWRAFGVVAAANIIVWAVVIWAIVQLVQWVTSK